MRINMLSAAASLGISPERTFVNLDRYGNTSAASIPIALCEAACDMGVCAGRPRPAGR